ncbi:hypothetical protein Cus16_2269 [Curtobacterium sp. ER1/6]|nr:hypothetical protein Cus16_2269 [Curtobacterium sp. ER1/6]
MIGRMLLSSAVRRDLRSRAGSGRAAFDAFVVSDGLGRLSRQVLHPDAGRVRRDVCGFLEVGCSPDFVAATVDDVGVHRRVLGVRPPVLPHFEGADLTCRCALGVHSAIGKSSIACPAPPHPDADRHHDRCGDRQKNEEGGLVPRPQLPRVHPLSARTSVANLGAVGPKVRPRQGCSRSTVGAAAGFGTAGLRRTRRPCSARSNDVRREAAPVVGDRAVGLADAHAERLAVHHPGPEDRVVVPVRPGEVRQLVVLLPHPLAGGPGATVLRAVRGHRPVGAVHGDAVALAAEDRLHDEVRHAVRPVGVRRQQVLVPGEQPPERHEQELVRQEHLPGGLVPTSEPTAVPHEEGPELLVARGAVLPGDQVLPRVELEEVPDDRPLRAGLVAGQGEDAPRGPRGLLVADELPGDTVPADVLHLDAGVLPTGLAGEVAHVRDGVPVLARGVEVRVRDEQPSAVLGAERVVQERPPPCDERFVDAVPLVGVGRQLTGLDALAHPVPLRDRSLDEPGGGVAVVLEELRGGAVAGVREVEARVDVRLALLEGPRCELEAVPRQAEGAEFARRHVPGGLEAHPVQLLGLLLERLDLGEGEDVGGAVVPVLDLGAVLAVRPRVDEPGLLDLPLPVRSRRVLHALHQPPNPPCSPDPPKPPFETELPRDERPDFAVFPEGSDVVPPEARSPTAGTRVLRLLLTGR